MNRQVILLALCFSIVYTTPAIEKEFHRMVNGNECLKSCMAPVRESDLELSIIKRANYSDHLLNLDTTCQLIETARTCIDNCGVQSNPFALESMKLICAPGPRKAVKLVEECMTEQGATVHDECRQQCGDFELMNEDIRRRTAAMKSEETSKTAELMKSTNDACAVLKCHARCSIRQFNNRCKPMADGQLAGNVVRGLVEDVLVAQRADLESHGLVEAMAQNSQPACNYLYDPRALFDHLSQQNHRDEGTNLLEVLKRNAQQKLSSTLGQLNTQVLEKTLDVLSKQERNLDREYEKINLDIARRMQNPFFRRPMF